MQLLKQCVNNFQSLRPSTDLHSASPSSELPPHQPPARAVFFSRHNFIHSADISRRRIRRYSATRGVRTPDVSDCGSIRSRTADPLIRRPENRPSADRRFPSVPHFNPERRRFLIRTAGKSKQRTSLLNSHQSASEQLPKKSV